MRNFEAATFNKLNAIIPSIPKIPLNSREITENLNNDVRITLQSYISPSFFYYPLNSTHDISQLNMKSSQDSKLNAKPPKNDPHSSLNSPPSEELPREPLKAPSLLHFT